MNELGVFLSDMDLHLKNMQCPASLNSRSPRLRRQCLRTELQVPATNSSPKKLFSSSWLDSYHWFHVFLSTYLAYHPLTCYSSKACILSFLFIMVLIYHLSFTMNDLIFSQSFHFLSNVQLLPLLCILVSVTETALSSICEQQF